MAGYKVEICGVNTAELPLLKAKEKEELLKKIKQGDANAREQFIKGNLRLVLSIVQRFNQSNENIDDLFQIGCIGMIKAIDNFDLSYGLKLSTYAVPLIIGEIKRYLRDNTAVRVSRSTKDLAYQIIKFKDKYLSEYGIDAPSSVISKELNIPEYLISYAMDAMRDPASIFEPIYNDGGDTIYLFDQIADTKDKNSDKDMIISLRRALLKIKEREKNILLQRFMVGKTQMEIADELGISQAQVSRLEKSAIENVRKLIK